MSWTDRDYNQSQYGGRGGQLLKMLNGSVKIFRFLEIDVRVHASLILFVGLALIFGLGQGFTWQDRLQSMSVLFAIVLLHEYGHCLTSRRVGGEPDEILMTPIGGLASAKPPHKAWPTFLTIAGGPAVNIVICIICGSIIYALTHHWPWDPSDIKLFSQTPMLRTLPRLTLWVYKVSYVILLFNLLPIFPLDGGQMLQSLLWARIGYARSMNASCVIGMVGAVGLAIAGIVMRTPIVVFIAISGFITCRMMRMQLKAMGSDLEFAGESGDMDFSESLKPDPPRKRLSPRAIRKAQRAVISEHAEQDRVDDILAKVSAQGMASLTWLERRALHQATARKRKHEAELTRERK